MSGRERPTECISYFIIGQSVDKRLDSCAKLSVDYLTSGAPVVAYGPQFTTEVLSSISYP